MFSTQCSHCAILKRFHYVKTGAKYLRPEEALRVLCTKCRGHHDNDVKMGDWLDECDECRRGVASEFEKTHGIEGCCCVRYIDGDTMAHLGCGWCGGTGYRAYALNASE